MTSENWERITEAFAGALQRDADEREPYLDEVCSGDPEFRTEVQALLAVHEQAERENFLELNDSRDGQTIGPYRIEKLLGGGGQGDVYLAVRVEPFYRRVAIKFVKPAMDTEVILRRFKSEMQIYAALGEYSNIASLMDAGATEDGRPYFVMEYVEGERIDHYCDTSKLNIRDRIMLFRSVLDAVQHAHQNLVIHLDLKPSNILVTKNGVPKMVDFGIARLVNPDLAHQTGTLTGSDGLTLRYASHEQVRRGAVITTASDVYSLGVVLYELLTGHRPYELEDGSPQEIERIVCEEDPEKPSIVIRRDLTVRKQDGTMRTLTSEDTGKLRDCRPSQLRRIIAGDIDKFLLKALRKEPQRRFSSVTEFSDALGDWLEWRPVQIPPSPTLLERFGLSCRRNPAVSSLTAVVMLLVLIVAVVTMDGYYRTTAALNTAEHALEQEVGFRQALLDTTAFQLRKEIVGNVAKDPRLLELLEKTILETKDLRDKLNVPKLGAEDKKRLKDQLQQHASRKELQQHLRELVKEQNQAAPVHNWFVLDSKGLLLAREEASRLVIGENYARRTYFHGGTRDYKDLQDYLDNAADNHVNKPHLSAALKSQSTGKPLWAVSTEVLDKEKVFVGVVGLRVEIGQIDTSPARP